MMILLFADRSAKLRQKYETEKTVLPVYCPFSVMDGIRLGHLPELRAYGIIHAAAVTALTQAEEIRKWRSILRLGKFIL